MNVTVLIIDSATKPPPEAEGAVILTGSHGASYAAYLSAKAGVRGRHEIDGILYLDSASMLGPDDRDRVAATGSHGASIASTTTAPMRPRSSCSTMPAPAWNAPASTASMCWNEQALPP